ncbi:DUF1127 domain-containing protein [Phycobacter sp. K97]|jgi:uncharacterized protein YjiS (DUF1127 family)|uniref:DUF1127 domain-containing protein n=1 Tax=Phycobacter sedimenti TaxID=3133977 RepID=UPI00311EDA98
MTYISLPSARARARRNLKDRIALAFALNRQRRALSKLDDTALSDIGISRKAADSEARRPFWDAPDFWLR